jgi:hypothetical protein
MTEWVKVPDEHVRHVWIDSNGKFHYVSPDFYESSGTPVCPETGDDMIYLRTEVAVCHVDDTNDR